MSETTIKPFSVGDVVFDATYGKGKVFSVDIDNKGEDQTIGVQFDSHKRDWGFYTADGKRFHKDAEPSLEHFTGGKLNRAPQTDFKTFDKVLVRECKGPIFEWRPAILLGIQKDESTGEALYMSSWGAYRDCVAYSGNEWAEWKCTDDNDYEVF